MSEGGATATPTAEELSRAVIARVDVSDQLGDVLALPDLHVAVSYTHLARTPAALRSR